MPNASFWIVLAAQGGGVGRIPWAPGSFGSLVGLAWALLVIDARDPWMVGLMISTGLAASVWCCGAAAGLMGHKDPASVVLDEIAAVPVVFLPWLAERWISGLPGPAWLGMLSAWDGFLCPAGFLLFRAFDIWKPWPIRQSQALPGGWGITVDDLLAAVGAGVGLLLLEFLFRRQPPW